MDIESFLNTPARPEEAYTTGDVRSLWILVRKSLRRLKCSIQLHEAEVYLTKDEKQIHSKQQGLLTNVLVETTCQSRLSQLLQAKDQGRAYHHISKSPVSSDWIQDGKYLSFTEYRFTIRARLNILPTKTVARRAGKSQLDTKYRRCKLQQETLGHILNACTPNTGLMRERHNKILERLVKAVPADLGDKFKEQKPLQFPGDLRPDLVVRNRNSGEVTIIDVTIPFESDKDAFDKARNEKAQKYSPLSDLVPRSGAH